MDVSTAIRIRGGCARTGTRPPAAEAGRGRTAGNERPEDRAAGRPSLCIGRIRCAALCPLPGGREGGSSGQPRRGGRVPSHPGGGRRGPGYRQDLARGPVIDPRRMGSRSARRAPAFWGRPRKPGARRERLAPPGSSARFVDARARLSLRTHRLRACLYARVGDPIPSRRETAAKQVGGSVNRLDSLSQAAEGQRLAQHVVRCDRGPGPAVPIWAKSPAASVQRAPRSERSANHADASTETIGSRYRGVSPTARKCDPGGGGSPAGPAPVMSVRSDRPTR